MQMGEKPTLVAEHGGLCLRITHFVLLLALRVVLM